MTLEHLLSVRRAEILNIAASHGARNVRVFGSYARGEATEESDVDLLVDFDAEHGLFDRVALIGDLEELLGREVDVVTEGASTGCFGGRSCGKPYRCDE